MFGEREMFQADPHWRDNVLFYEYFHGDNGTGFGCQPPDGVDRPGGDPDPALGSVDAEQFLKGGKKGAFARQ